MTDKISEHLDMLLENAPKTRRVEEMRQELLSGCLDKYEDLIADGMSAEEAFLEVAEGIGDVNELLGIIEKGNVFDPAKNEERRKKRAFFISVGLCFYFVALACVIFLAGRGMGEIGAGMMFIFLGLGTVAIVYGVMTTGVRYEKADDTIVEEIKRQMTAGSRERRMLSLASSTLWCFVVVIYFAVSFFTSAYWHLTWIIFLLGAAAQSLLSARFKPETARKSYMGMYWCLVAAIYIVISFASFQWAVTWLIFPVAVMAMQAGRLFFEWRNQ
ncbi:MAG: hypothetical protein GX823_00770 [Clostridiales bacterium]|nr:hypothetical protein [Clostridiales bacterium]